ncbi:MAG: acyl-CoA thioesterase [Euryarchaeota archaeon]|nr:acyl-CoA thioesterase [Euryarchaeota archaeon]
MREHTLEIPVRWGDLDPAGIIYYPNVFHYFEIAIEEFFQAHGLNYNQMAARFRTGFPRVAASAEFHAPIRLSDVLLCRIFVERMGNTSLTFGFELKRKKDGVVCVTGKVTNVALNPGTWRPVPLPAGLRQMIEGPPGKSG